MLGEGGILTANFEVCQNSLCVPRDPLCILIPPNIPVFFIIYLLLVAQIFKCLPLQSIQYCQMSTDVNTFRQKFIKDHEVATVGKLAFLDCNKIWRKSNEQSKVRTPIQLKVLAARLYSTQTLICLTTWLHYIVSDSSASCPFVMGSHCISSQPYEISVTSNTY